MITDIREQMLINELLLACFANDNEKQNLLRVSLCTIDEELGLIVGKTWLYNQVADICSCSQRTAYNKIAGLTDWNLTDLQLIQKYFDNAIGIEQIIKFLETIKELMQNEK